MTIRMDKFVVGDKVVWADAYRESGFVDIHGNGPFTILRVYDRENDHYNNDSDDGRSLWQDMGHTQHVVLAELPGETSFWSGAWFTKVNGDENVSYPNQQDYNVNRCDSGDSD